MTKEYYKNQLNQKTKILKPFRDKLDYWQRGELDFAVILIKTSGYDTADYEECLNNLSKIITKQ